MSTKHTPKLKHTPELFAAIDSGDYGRTLCDRNSPRLEPNVIGECLPAYAELILRCVNSHDALVAALRGADETIRELIPYLDSLDCGDNKVIDAVHLFVSRRRERISAALAAAEGQS